MGKAQPTKTGTRVLIIEENGHVGYGAIANSLALDNSLAIESSTMAPSELRRFDAIIISNLDVSKPTNRFSPESLSDYVAEGGGVVALHDSLFYHQGFGYFLEMLGIHVAFDAMEIEETGPNTFKWKWHLAVGHPTEPMSKFPVKVIPGDPPHPIVNGIETFEIGDEFWAINTAPDVDILMQAEVGDRLPVRPRLQKPVPILGARQVGKGRTVFCLLGHFEATYSNPNYCKLMYNAVLWVVGRTHRRSHRYDLFISYAAEDVSTAQKIDSAAKERKLEVFLAKRKLEFGDVWDEEIRKALLSSREICIIVSSNSLRSEWVTTEWGAAWALDKRITPYLVSVNPEELPARLKRYQAAKNEDLDDYLNQVARRLTR